MVINSVHHAPRGRPTIGKVADVDLAVRSGEVGHSSSGRGDWLVGVGVAWASVSEGVGAASKEQD